MTDDKTDVREPMGGYHGKILRVDLTGHTLTDEPITYEFVRK